MGTAVFLLLFGGKGCIARYPIIVAEEPCGGEVCGAFSAGRKALYMKKPYSSCTFVWEFRFPVPLWRHTYPNVITHDQAFTSPCVPPHALGELHRTLQPAYGYHR